MYQVTINSENWEAMLPGSKESQVWRPTRWATDNKTD